MTKYFKYFFYICFHKIYVARELVKFGPRFYWRALVHDNSKIFRFFSEFLPYAKHFEDRLKHINGGVMGYSAWLARASYDFRLARLKHCNRNDHHFEHFLTIDHEGDICALRMPEKALIEMFTDICGTSRQLAKYYPAFQGTSAKDFYEREKEKLKLHSESRKQLERLIYEK